MNLEKIKNAIRNTLSEKEEIIASYLYGSFINRKYFRDLDVGLLINDTYKPNVLYEARISGELEIALKPIFDNFKTIDVRILNDKPLSFLFSVLKNSELIFSKNESKRVKFEADIIKKYLDIKPHYELYNKMRRLRYANR